jgi:hypothetical protein
MASTRSTIEIEGIYGTEVLNTFNIIRGFATLQELARISVPVLMDEPAANGGVQGHQRPLDDVHAEEVKKYFEQGDRRFIPEIILSLRVPLTAEIITPRGAFQALQVGVSYSGGGILLKRKNKGKSLPNHTLKISTAHLKTIKAEQRIRRIDGNHRLAKAEELAVESGQTNRYKVPFCLLLLGDIGDAFHDYTEALVFHTINSTAKPLDGEQALKLILGQPAALTQPPLQEFAFAPALHFTRLLDESLRGLPESARGRLGGRTLARLSIASKELLRSYPEKAASLEIMTAFKDEVFGALTDICTHLHQEFPDFCAADYFIELAGHVWMKSNPTDLHSKRLADTVDYLRSMARWMGIDGMRGLTVDKPLGRQLTEIYDAVVSRVPKKVFLARWYPDVNDGEQKQRATNRYQLLKELVESLGLELVDLANKTGGTYEIHHTMYREIRSSDIFIADLTGLRPNVMIELGYALQSHQPQGRMLLMFNPIPAPADKVPFDTNTFRYEEIGEAADIPSALKKHLDDILEKARLGEI